MPHKYAKSKSWHVPKQQYKITNWSEYNQSLKNRGSIDIWLSKEAIAKWYEADQQNIGDGTPQQYTDFAIRICHEIRLVYKQPLRQTEGFINSLFEIMGLEIKCPNFSTLSKRLKALDIKCPKYTEKDQMDNSVAAIAIDSTGLKRFGRDEWHQEKHKVSAKRSWRKFHAVVSDKHYIHACKLTDRFETDEGIVDQLFDQIDVDTDHFSADGAYDSYNVYELINNKFPNAEVSIPPDKNAKIGDSNHILRNHNLELIDRHGRMNWQRQTQYGKRNASELAMQRYKRIVGKSMYSRDFENQKQESMIGASILNKMTSLGMPISHRTA
ncbi:IS5 family transposase [Francisella sp. TX07-6608]|uniref:IS5 family transposase n=1 Tax=Francisella sp. TX07-6608 TaxID=573568 RepID=UPI0008F99090|nr:IS5 family transposase [Francisella sp. TX07-6608]OIN84954.1 transposase DDE domain protein [Francisella sp. TX07-6608]OIN85000.1 transposase DDE domain protein [Francisella sp. TX07-6608]